MEILDDYNCRECIVIGECKIEDLSQVNKLLEYKRNNEFQVKKLGISYIIEVEQLFNRKTVKISTDTRASLYRVYLLLMDVLRFENLYEGTFFTFVSFIVDGQECLEKYKQKFLNYMHSDKKYILLPLDCDNKIYKTMFLRFQKEIKKSFFRHQAFLNALFVNDLTVDLRMSLLLEVFESLVNELADDGVIILKAQPYRSYQNKCNKCGAMVSRKIPNKDITLFDKLYAVIKEYGDVIFDYESKTKIARKGVNLRNKIDHINKQKNAMQGKQAGFYLHKFGLLYRVMLLKRIGGYNDRVQSVVSLWTVEMNNAYSGLRILP